MKSQDMKGLCSHRPCLATEAELKYELEQGRMKIQAKLSEIASTQ